MKTVKPAKLYRQGDVLIQRVCSFPKQLKKVAPEGQRLVLAHGSATGHSHSLDAKAGTLSRSEAVNATGALFLEVKVKSAKVTHDEHSTIVLPKGKYRVTRQSEYSPEVVRTVTD